jgi:hypothetical protein
MIKSLLNLGANTTRAIQNKSLFFAPAFYFAPKPATPPPAAASRAPAKGPAGKAAAKKDEGPKFITNAPELPKFEDDNDGEDAGEHQELTLEEFSVLSRKYSIL